MADQTNDPEYQEYQQYLEYLKHTGQGAQAAASPGNAIDAYYARHDNDSVTDKLKAMILGRKDNPMVDSDVPLAFPAEAVPAAASAVQKIASSPYGRVALSAAQGGAEGLVRTPGEGETRIGNALRGAKMGALLSSGAEGLSQMADAGKAAATYAGGKLVGATYPQAQNYVEDPKLANAMYDLNKNDPMELSNQIKQHVGGGLDEAFDRVSQPALDRVGKAVAGKQIQVAPADFNGTQAGNEINRAYSAQGNTVKMDVPTYEPHTVQMDPMRESLGISDPQTQTVQDANPYNLGPKASIDVPVSTTSPKVVKAGDTQTLEDLLIPRGTQSVEAPAAAPDRTNITGPQALTAKRASQKAAFQNQANALNPLAYNASDDAEAQAAARLRKAIENVAPSTAADNDTLEQAARYSAHAKSTLKNNPASILVDSDSTGSLPTRSMRQFLDEKGGTQLGQLSDALSAGKAVNGENTHSGILDRLLARPAGKALLGGASKISPEAIQSLPAPILDALMRDQSK